MSDQFDQTSFGETQPMFEPAGLPQAPVTAATAPIAKPSKKINPLIILTVAVVIMAAITVTAMLFTPQQKTRTPIQATAVPSSTPTVAGPMQSAIDDLESDIKKADPLTNDLPFPPVNFNLHLQNPNAIKNE